VTEGKKKITAQYKPTNQPTNGGVNNQYEGRRRNDSVRVVLGLGCSITG
jgi:hypothetical protein